MRYRRLLLLAAIVTIGVLIQFGRAGSILPHHGLADAFPGDGTSLTRLRHRQISNVRTAYIIRPSPNSRTVSISGVSLSASDANKDILVYDATPYYGYRKNVFSGCIQSVSSATTVQLGTWSGGVCVATPYPGPAATGALPIIYGTDGTAALQSKVNTLGAGQRTIIRETLLIHDTIVFKNKVGGELGGITANGQVRTFPFSGSNIVWVGPARKPMFRLENTGGMYIHDLHLVGNSNPRNRPSAFVDIAQTVRVPPNKFAGISNMAGGAWDNPGGGVWDNVDNGIYIEPGSVGSAHEFINVRLYNVGTACFNVQNSPRPGPQFLDTTCQHTPVVLYCVNGGSVTFSGATEMLTVGQAFHLGGGCAVSARDVEAENDSPGNEGITKLAYFARGNGPFGGGSLRIGHGGFAPTAKLPTAATPAFLGHKLTPNALVDTDTSAPVILDIRNFSFAFSAIRTYAYTRSSPWLINLPAAGAPSRHYFSCQYCYGLTGANINLDPGGYAASANTVYVEGLALYYYSPQSIFVRQTLSDSQRLNPFAGGVFDNVR